MLVLPFRIFLVSCIFLSFLASLSMLPGIHFFKFHTIKTCDIFIHMQYSHTSFITWNIFVALSTQIILSLAVAAICFGEFRNHFSGNSETFCSLLYLHLHSIKDISLVTEKLHQRVVETTKQNKTKKNLKIDFLSYLES